MKKIVLISIIVLMVSPSFADKLTLEQSTSLALKNNEAVIIAQNKAEAAQARVSQAFSLYLPSVSLSASYTRAYQAPIQSIFNGTPIVFGINDPGDFKEWDITVTQNVFTFGKLENSLMMAIDGASSAREELRKAQQDTIYNVSSAYFNVSRAQKRVDLAKGSLDMADAHLDQVNSLFTSGIATKADILRSEVARAIANQDLIKAKNAYSVACSVLNNALGQDLDAELETVDETSASASADYKYDDLLLSAKAMRPESRLADLSQDMAAKNSSLAFSGWLPNVMLQGKYGWMNNNYSTVGVNYDATNWNVTAAASWKLFDGFATQAKIKEANANLDAAKASRALAMKSIALDLKQAYLNYASANDLVDAAKKGVESATENYAIADLRYRNGLGTNIDLLDAQTALTKAQVDDLSAGFDLALAKLSLARAAGVLDVRTGSNIMDKTVLEGKMKFIDVEGGFIGFVGNDGSKYDLSGTNADEIFKTMDKKSPEKKIRITGYPKNNILTTHMWGTPFEVETFEWR